MDNVVTSNYIPAMKAVGIRELKARLSHYLREVQRGEVVLVTDRGRVVAELRTPGGVPDQSETDLGWQRLAASGGLRVGEPHRAALYRTSPIKSRPGTARALLDEERADA